MVTISNKKMSIIYNDKKLEYNFESNKDLEYKNFILIPQSGPEIEHMLRRMELINNEINNINKNLSDFKTFEQKKIDALKSRSIKQSKINESDLISYLKRRRQEEIR